MTALSKIRSATASVTDDGDVSDRGNGDRRRRGRRRGLNRGRGRRRGGVGYSICVDAAFGDDVCDGVGGGVDDYVDSGVGNDVVVRWRW